MPSQDNEASRFNKKFESEMDFLLKELKEMKEILFSHQDKRKEINERISILENEMDEKNKLKGLNKEEEDKYKNQHEKLKEFESKIKEKIKRISNDIQQKEKQIEKIGDSHLKNLRLLAKETAAQSEIVQRQSMRLKEELSVSSLKLAEMYQYIRSNASKKDKKVAQVKVYLTEPELKILENLTAQKGSDKSSVMRDFLRGENMFPLSGVFMNRVNSFGEYIPDEPQKCLIKVFEPKKFEDVYKYPYLLEEGICIIVNFASLNEINPNLKQRCIDFIYGSIFRSEGKVTEIGPSTIICTPEESNIKIQENLSN